MASDKEAAHHSLSQVGIRTIKRQTRPVDRPSGGVPSICRCTGRMDSNGVARLARTVGQPIAGIISWPPQASFVRCSTALGCW